MTLKLFQFPIFGYIPLTTFVVIVTFVIYSVFVRKITVFSVVLLVKFFLETLHQAIKLFLIGYFLHPVYYDLVNFSWYFLFAVTDILAVIVMYKLVDILKLSKNWLLRSFGVIYIALAIVQAIGYVDRFVIESDIFAEFYSYSIVYANAIGAGLLIWYFLVEVTNHVKERGSENTLY